MRETVREWLSAITIWEKIALAGAAAFAVIRLAMSAPEIFPPYRPITEAPENTGIVATEAEGEVAGTNTTPQPQADQPSGETNLAPTQVNPPSAEPETTIQQPAAEEEPVVKPPVTPPVPVPERPVEEVDNTLDAIRRVLPKPLQDLL